MEYGQDMPFHQQPIFVNFYAYDTMYIRDLLTVIRGLCSGKPWITDLQSSGPVWCEETLGVKHGIKGPLSVSFIQADAESVREQAYLFAASETSQVGVIGADNIHLPWKYC